MYAASQAAHIHTVCVRGNASLRLLRNAEKKRKSLKLCPKLNSYTFRGISFRLLFCSYWTAAAAAAPTKACLFLLGEARQRSVCADFVLANVCRCVLLCLRMCV